jgi:hypothetical protein
MVYLYDCFLILVNTPQNSINRADPANSYNAIYLQHVFATIDAFKSYTNTLGFFSGNEVVNDANTTGVPLLPDLTDVGFNLGQSNNARYESLYCKAK